MNSIPNFVCTDLLHIGPADSKKWHLVALRQSAGGMSFFHAMLPEQARAMAAALIAEADAADAKALKEAP